MAAASISQRLGALAIVVSESGVVRVFHLGQIAATLIPELWLLDRHHTQLSVAAAGTVEAQRLGVTALSQREGVGTMSVEPSGKNESEEQGTEDSVATRD